jgi:uncharacterized protein (TIGR03067 family)
MLRLSKLAALAAAVLLAGGCAATRNPVAVDPAMTGTWLPVKAELSGKPFNFVKDFRLEVTGDRFVTQGGSQKDIGKLVFLDGDPRGVDVIGEDGTNKGQRLPAIYRFSAGQLEVCYDLSGKERPAEFATRPDTRLFLITYKRKP